MQIINITAYKFVTLTKLPTLRAELLGKCNKLKIKGTIILSEEGVNILLAGSREAIDAMKAFIASYPQFSDLPYKESITADYPFKKMVIKIKPEIITMRVPDIKPEVDTVPHLSAKQLKQWLDQGKDVVILDTRNTYEIEMGTFDNAIDLNIENFRDFPQACQQLPEALKDKTIVTFCTGGVRCEKAGPLLAKQGFNHVYQLDGGVLRYFEECGGAYWHGDCFVFDERLAVTPELKSTNEAYAQ